MTPVRDLIRTYQREIRQTADLQVDRAAAILNHLSALIGNVNDEIREADAAYAVALLAIMEAEQKANRARIRAETTPEYQRKREARDEKELLLELTRSLKYFLKAKADEWQLARHT
jgi:hypothetical protein